MKYLAYLKYALLILSVVIGVYAIGSYTEGDATTESGIGIMLGFAGVMLGLTGILAVGMPLVGILQNPKSAGKALIGVALVAIVFIVSYALSEATPITLPSGRILDDAAELRFADVALWSMYIMFGALLVSMVGSEIYKAIK